MRECTDPDGALRLVLLGGLDIVVADRLTSRLQALRAEGRALRIDLSGLEFIDCTGMAALIDELTSGRRLGRSVEVDRPVSAPVKRAITFMDVASDLWPPESEVARTVLRVIDGDGEPAPGERTAALRERANGDGENHLGLVVGDPVEPSRPRGAPHG
jgi:anti-anti-sigma factor